LVYDTLSDGNVNNLWQSQRNANGMSGFAYVGTAIEFASAPALYCSGGGINRDGSGKTQEPMANLFPKLCQSFRAKYCAKLKRNHLSNTNKSGRIYGKPWVVFAKKPLKYKIGGIFGRYTHKIAINNQN
jgi:hypothetical protein